MPLQPVEGEHWLPEEAGTAILGGCQDSVSGQIVADLETSARESRKWLH